MDAADLPGTHVVTAEAGGMAARVWDAVATVVDPEIPVLTIEDLGVLRDVAIEDDGTVIVTITPTYSGCPAMQLIEDQIALTLDIEGIRPYRIETVFSPAWTTDWMTDEAREKLRSVGIAPPIGPPKGGTGPDAADDEGVGRDRVGGLRLPEGHAEGSRHEARDHERIGTGNWKLEAGKPLCPRCTSDDTRTVSEFGSTACKALMVCGSCREPFDLFKRLA